MATSTELLRAAEHMRERADAIARLDPHADDFRRGTVRYSVRQCADELEAEAKRVRANEWDETAMVRHIAAILSK